MDDEDFLKGLTADFWVDFDMLDKWDGLTERDKLILLKAPAWLTVEE